MAEDAESLRAAVAFLRRDYPMDLAGRALDEQNAKYRWAARVVSEAYLAEHPPGGPATIGETTMAEGDATVMELKVRRKDVYDAVRNILLNEFKVLPRDLTEAVEQKVHNRLEEVVRQEVRNDWKFKGEADKEISKAVAALRLELQAMAVEARSEMKKLVKEAVKELVKELVDERMIQKLLASLLEKGDRPVTRGKNEIAVLPERVELSSDLFATGLKSEDPGTWFGRVRLLGVPHRVELVQVEGDGRGGQYGVGGPDGPAAGYYSHMQRYYEGPYDAVRVPGVDGEFVIFIHPLGEGDGD